ncbi:C-type lectin domain-containing protein [Caenorhabditis elegans]|uniref:C-type lectin domain-containing protein n=1 Tax=Caenorhabditis elegans TaxID=6239 RepID=U4PB15_CAEEL|nr:C-type lectin domain-containing protein [Caenorhabditis elegans]CDH92950.1 C-type lectin domain-containing protein [Caenorhabditis elegans]|eukprot:NP_001294256.1 Uncharacterized protein CELE_Y54G2A.7 [Caenorhabditis elegans]
MKILPFVLIAIASAAKQCYDSEDRLISGMCYKLVNQQLSYDDALNWCHYSNPVAQSYLAMVADQTTASFLASYARTTFNINEGKFWIGLSRKSSTSPWSWDNGIPLQWTNFAAPLGQNYVAQSMVNTKWSTYTGTDKNFFACSYDPDGVLATTTQEVPTTTGAA